MKKGTPYIYLKFGRIKGIDFKDNADAKKLYEELDIDDRNNMASVIKAYNGKFYLWWEGRNCSKREAVDYVLNYIDC